MYIKNRLNKVLFGTIMFCFFSVFSQSKNFRVTLDAGHGGKDWGATYNGHVEKNIALAVILKVGKILESQSNFDVNYTRKTDVFIDLIERANIANRVDANIFVSIHCNANKNTAADGTETYVMGMTKNASSLAVAKNENEVVTMEKDYKQKYEGYDPKSPETIIGVTLMQEEFMENSIALASKIQDAFSILGKKIRGGGVKQANFMVLHKAYMPRVLVEMGFISNPAEGAELDSEVGQDKIAEAIARAIISYKKEYFGTGNTDEESERPSQKIIEKDADIISKTKENQTKESPKQLPNKENSKDLKKVSKPEIAKDTQKEAVPSDGGKAIFKVQIAASSKKLDVAPSNFKGLKNITISGSDIYKYMYGETSSYDQAKTLLQEAKSKGYSSAFIVAFKNGKIISVQDAIK
jgi:N-acetylmuramoyl-L-alanine amidase